MADALPDDWREQVVDMIRGAAPLDGALFAGGPGLSPVEQIGVYRRQYELRVPAALAEDAPGLFHLVGDAWDDLARRYLLDHPPTSWSLDHLGRDLERWLERTGAPPAHVEMARVDEAVQRSFVAAHGDVPRPEDLSVLPPLRLQPHVELVQVTRSVHRYRAEVLGGQEPDALVEGPFDLVLYRRDRRVRHLEMPRAAWWILAHLHEGTEAAIERALEVASAEELQTRLAGWFRLFAERGLVQLA